MIERFREAYGCRLPHRMGQWDPPMARPTHPRLDDRDSLVSGTPSSVRAPAR
jgi:hypothetical protein